MTITGKTIRNLWANGKSITLDNVKYRVGKMNYGDYFLEPGKPGPETEPFNKDTLWPNYEPKQDIFII